MQRRVSLASTTTTTLFLPPMPARKQTRLAARKGAVDVPEGGRSNSKRAPSVRFRLGPANDGLSPAPADEMAQVRSTGILKGFAGVGTSQSQDVEMGEDGTSIFYLLGVEFH